MTELGIKSTMIIQTWVSDRHVLKNEPTKPTQEKQLTVCNANDKI